MVRCMLCGSENPSKNKTCSYCGSKLEQVNVKNNAQEPKNMLISVLLAVFLPGISFFYLKQWYRGISYLVLYFAIMFVYSFVGGMYSSISLISVSLISYFVLVSYFILYLIGIYDMINQTKQINIHFN